MRRSFGSARKAPIFADHIVRRKHTANAKRDLPGLIGELVEPLTLHREQQHKAFLRYMATPLNEAQVNDAVMTMYRRNVINVQRIADVMEQWDHPAFSEWGDRTAWRPFNAATFALSGRIVENSEATTRLHEIIDGACNAKELAHAV